MAILFDDAASEYLTIASVPMTNEPITMACWFYSDSLTAGQTLLALGDSGGVNGIFALEAAGDQGGDPVRAAKGTDGGTFGIAATTSGYSANTWHHAIATFTSDTERAVYIDGGSVGSNVTNITDPTADNLAVGASHRSTAGRLMSGRIAEAAIWDVILSADDRAILALGFSPLFVKPENLVFYLPMLALGGAGTQYDWIGNRAMAEINTPATAEHPPQIIYPPWLTSGGLVFSSSDLLHSMPAGNLPLVGVAPSLQWLIAMVAGAIPIAGVAPTYSHGRLFPAGVINILGLAFDRMIPRRLNIRSRTRSLLAAERQTRLNIKRRNTTLRAPED